MPMAGDSSKLSRKKRNKKTFFFARLVMAWRCEKSLLSLHAKQFRDGRREE